MKKLPTILFLLILCSCKNTAIKVLEKTVPDTTNSASSFEGDDKVVEFNTTVNFDSFKTKVYTGKIANPDFRNNPFSKDKEYVKFITRGCKVNGINFGGHYTIIQKGCGAMCEHIFIVDRISGKILTHIIPDDGRYGYLYRKDSYLLIANANSFQDDSLKYYDSLFGKPELYVWRDANFELISD